MEIFKTDILKKEFEKSQKLGSNTRNSIIAKKFHIQSKEKTEHFTENFNLFRS